MRVNFDFDLKAKLAVVLVIVVVVMSFMNLLATAGFFFGVVFSYLIFPKLFAYTLRRKADRVKQLRDEANRLEREL